MVKKIIISLFILVSLAIGGFFAYSLGFFGTIYSDSMVPTYPIGAFTVVNPFERTMKVGDVVTYKCQKYSKCPNSYTWTIEHRLVKIENGCYHFHGDNPKYNWDSVPCLMRDEFNLLGVSHKLY